VTKHVFRVNLAQIRSAVPEIPEIFHTQTKKTEIGIKSLWSLEKIGTPVYMIIAIKTLLDKSRYTGLRQKNGHRASR